ncbi:thiamine ABC transporter substrate-binding protein [Natronomonas sp. EA1]|uniref:thiamine ABC transporter substrate-binding protein n=1 Tax=Natronomonas sp. EA1 TaxID=3421655 RepID=UPI003EBCEF08
MKRREFLSAAGVAGVAGLAGCTGFTGGGEPTGTLTVATYPSFVDDEEAAGAWLKSAFESEYDATVEFETPDSSLNYYIRRAQEDVPIEADVYVGLNTDQLIRLDSELEEPLFAESQGDLANGDAVKQRLQFDPTGRAVPYDTGYISLVYDENEVDEPPTFDALLDPAYEDTLIVQNAQTAATGRAFLLWSIHTLGDGWLDYWRELKANGITVVGSWSDSYNAYLNGEKPIVVSYSTDQVYASAQGQDLSKHQIGFLNDQGYANPEGMARFASAGNAELATAFMDFMLTPEAQGEIATRNVQFPAIDDADLPEDFAKYAKEPPEPVTFTYEELKGNVNEWVDTWAREIAQG